MRGFFIGCGQWPLLVQEGGFPPRGRVTFVASKVTKTALPERGPRKPRLPCAPCSLQSHAYGTSLCRSRGLGIRPPWMAEVQVLQEQKPACRRPCGLALLAAVLGSRYGHVGGAKSAITICIRVA